MNIGAGAVALLILAWVAKQVWAAEGLYIRDKIADALVALAARLHPPERREIRRREWRAELVWRRSDPRYPGLSGLALGLGCCGAAIREQGSRSYRRLRAVRLRRRAALVSVITGVVVGAGIMATNGFSVTSATLTVAYVVQHSVALYVGMTRRPTGDQRATGRGRPARR